VRAPIPRYRDGWDAGVAYVEAEIAKRERPVRWARAELAKIRATRGPASPHPTPTSLALRDDFAWGFRDGSAVTLANFLYRVDNLAEHL
jgi:hypothetical protein